MMCRARTGCVGAGSRSGARPAAAFSTDWRMDCSKSWSSISVRATPMRLSESGSCPAAARDASAGYSLRWARSPVAPKTTIVLATRSLGGGAVAIAAMIRPGMDRTTIGVYESRAPEWRDRRPARFTDRAERFAAPVPAGAVRGDLGCGAWRPLPYLGRPVVPLDAAVAMLELCRDVAPDAALVQAHLEALPFRAGALGR